MTTHYTDPLSTTGYPACGISLGGKSTVTSVATEVTCKSCLKSQPFRNKYPELALPDHRRNPRLANLTNAGKGRPAKGLVRVTIGLDPGLIERIDAIATRTKRSRNDTIADMCQFTLDSPGQSHVH